MWRALGRVGTLGVHDSMSRTRKRLSRHCHGLRGVQPCCGTWGRGGLRIVVLDGDGDGDGEVEVEVGIDARPLDRDERWGSIDGEAY